MKRLLLSLGLLVALVASASAQCVAVGGVNSVPQTGMGCASEPTIATYGATSVGLVPAASATDVFCLTGSATKVIRVQRLRLSGSAGTLVNVPITVLKRASANTGGTLATTTALPAAYALDSTNVAATATLSAWTANPTLVDSAPGILAAATLGLSTTGTTLSGTGVLFDWESRNFMQAVTLRGIAQQMCVNFNAVSVSSGVVNINVAWTEAAQ